MSTDRFNSNEHAPAYEGTMSFEEGIEARRLSPHDRKNPYPVSSMRHRAWAAGWSDEDMSAAPLVCHHCGPTPHSGPCPDIPAVVEPDDIPDDREAYYNERAERMP